MPYILNRDIAPENEHNVIGELFRNNIIYADPHTVFKTIANFDVYNQYNLAFFCALSSSVNVLDNYETLVLHRE
jgi:hypothetical protein